MPGLGTLGQFDFDHLDHLPACLLCKQVRIENALRRAATEIAGSDLPDQVTTVFKVPLAQPTFAGVMGKISEFCAAVEGHHGIAAQGAVTHGGDIQRGGFVGPGASRPTKGDPQINRTARRGSH